MCTKVDPESVRDGIPRISALKVVFLFFFFFLAATMYYGNDENTIALSTVFSQASNPSDPLLREYDGPVESQLTAQKKPLTNQRSAAKSVKVAERPSKSNEIRTKSKLFYFTNTVSESIETSESAKGTEPQSKRNENRTQTDLLYFPDISSPANETEQARDGITIIIPTYRRERMLLHNNVLMDYSALHIVDRIVIMWNDVGTMPSQAVLDHFRRPEFHKKVVIYMQKQNSLLNRYDTKLVRTSAIFSIDDDQCVVASALKVLFETWKVNPDYFVGSFHRLALCKNKRCRYAAENDLKTFNLLLPGGGLMSSKASFDAIFDEKFRASREWVDNHMNCEDILANLALPKESSRKIYVPVERCTIPSPGRTKGLSNKSRHYTIRSSCISVFREQGLYVPPPQVVQED